MAYSWWKPKSSVSEILEYCGKVQYFLSESEPSRYSLHTVTRIGLMTMMRKTDDLTVVQKTLTDIYLEGKATEGHCWKDWLFSECCTRTHSWEVDWKGKVQQETLHKQQAMTTALGGLPNKADSRTWGSFTRSGLRLKLVHQESPHSRLVQEVG